MSSLLDQQYTTPPPMESLASLKPRNDAKYSSPAPAFPAELTCLKQWVGGRLEERRNPNGIIIKTKVPYSPITERRARINDPHTWGSFPQAWEMVKNGRADFLMLAIVEGSGLVLTDLDDCRDAETGKIEPWAQEIIEAQNTFAETSTSGTGVHTIGRATKPGSRCRRWKHDHGDQIEIYESGRFAVMTGDVLPGYTAIRDTRAHLDAFYREHWARHQITPTAQPLSAGTSTVLDSETIIAKASSAANGAKFRALYEDGDTGAYHGGDHSAADAGLCALVAWWTKDPTQILDIWRSSALYRKKTDRQDYAERTIASALEVVGGAGYSTDLRSDSRLIVPPPAATDPDLEGKSAEELRAIVRQQTAIIEAEHAARIAAEERAAHFAIERSGLLQILRNPDLSLGERVTGFALALDLHARIANGEQPTPTGFKAPAKRYAEMTGQSEGTVAKHLRELSDDPNQKKRGKGLITKHVVRETTEREIEGEVIDSSSGEIRNEREIVRGLRDVNYVEVPEGKIINIIDRLRTYQRPEGETKHGGLRPRPACEHHPDAGTVVIRSERVECACCRAILQESEPKRTYYPPETDDDLDEESSGIKMTPEQETVVNVLSDSKMTPEPRGGGAGGDVTGSIMQPDPFVGTHRPKTSPGWEDERRRTYGEAYRAAEVAS